MVARSHHPEGLTEVGRAAADFVASRASADAAWARFDAQARIAESIYPPLPDCIRDPKAPVEWLPPYELARLDRLESHMLGRIVTNRTDAFTAMLAGRERIDEALGVNALEEEWMAASASSDAAAARVVQARPVTIQDATLKYATLLAFHATKDRDDLIAKAGPFVTFLSDLEALAA
jgi:hypothetical protein